MVVTCDGFKRDRPKNKQKNETTRSREEEATNTKVGRSLVFELSKVSLPFLFFKLIAREERGGVEARKGREGRS